jgi:hypothetical protein
MNLVSVYPLAFTRRSRNFSELGVCVSWSGTKSKETKGNSSGDRHAIVKAVIRGWETPH